MTVFLFAYWYEPDAPADPVGLVRCWNLARAWTRAGDRVVAFMPAYASARLQREFTVRPIPLLSWRLLRQVSYAVGSCAAALLESRRGRPSMVYYRWFESPHPLVLARLLRATCVCEAAGEPVPSWWAATHGRLRVWLSRRLAGLALRRADRVVVLTDGLRDHLVREYGLAAERVTVIPSGTDTELFGQADRAECRRRLGLPADADLIGFIGSFYRYQGLETLIEILPGLKQRRPRARLVFVGDGEERGRLRDRADALGLADSVIWPGRVPYQDVPSWIGAMDVCVAPFRADRGETSPVKLFDALSCSRPVVATAIPSVAGMFSEEQGVVLVPPAAPEALAEAIWRVLENPEWAAALGRRGRRVVEERYSWTALLRRLQHEVHAAGAPA
jgi:glycosyltransferase involved in cell wall biosynthesis